MDNPVTPISRMHDDAVAALARLLVEHAEEVLSRLERDR